MMEFAALTYGLLISVILSAVKRNRKLNKAHPPTIFYSFLLSVVRPDTPKARLARGPARR